MTPGVQIAKPVPRRSLLVTPPELARSLSVGALTLAIYDDHVSARTGLPVVLAETGVRVVDAAPIVPEIADRELDPVPSVAIVADGERGDELAQRLAEQRGVPVLRLMSDPSAAADMLAVLASGASGAVCRRCAPERFRRAIDAVARGGMSFECPHSAAAAGTRAPILSPRERRVATELARGATTEEIAESLFLSPHTVRTHIRNIQRKLGARTRTHAIAVAIANRELSPPDA